MKKVIEGKICETTTIARVLSIAKLWNSLICWRSELLGVLLLLLYSLLMLLLFVTSFWMWDRDSTSPNVICRKIYNQLDVELELEMVSWMRLLLIRWQPTNSVTLSPLLRLPPHLTNTPENMLLLKTDRGRQTIKVTRETKQKMENY